MTRYGGILGALAEAVDIQAEHDCSAEEAHAIQRERAATRLREHNELQEALAGKQRHSVSTEALMGWLDALERRARDATSLAFADSEKAACDKKLLRNERSPTA